MTQQATFEQLTQLKLAGMLQAYREQINNPPFKICHSMSDLVSSLIEN